jgi:hypothetical protein
MRQPPRIFARVVSYAPGPLIFALFPFKILWLEARNGTLKVGDMAPDFDLATLDGKSRVKLSDYRGQKPVVLVFGSYT